MLRFKMILQITLLGSCIVTHGAVELPGIDMQFHVLFEVASICRFIVTVRTVKRLRPIVNLSCMSGHFVLI